MANPPSRSVHPPAGAGLPERDPQAPSPGEVVTSHYRWCVGCGADHPAGLHMRVVAGEGLTMTSTLEIGDFHQGAPGLAHGGVIATAMDEAMGVLNRLLLAPAVTVHLEVDYRRPVPVGSTLDIRTEIIGRVGRKIYTQGEARLGSADGAVAVRAAALFLQVPLEHFIDNGSPDHIAAVIRERSYDASEWRREVNP